jgi:hypothetical protein
MEETMNVPLLQRPEFARDGRLIPLDDRPHSATRWLMALIATSLSAGVLMAAVLPGWIGVDYQTASRSAMSAGVSTVGAAGEARVYELPPVYVVANRKTELAKMQREEQLVPLNQAARSKPAPKPPA